MKRNRFKYFVGFKSDGTTVAFRTLKEGTEANFGHIFFALMGEFKTARGAKFYELYHVGNPHTQTTYDCDRHAKSEPMARNLPIF